MAAANPLWGTPGIHGELLKLGVEISERTVSRLMPRRILKMHMRERFNEIPGTARQSFFNQSLVRFPQILYSTDIGEAQRRGDGHCISLKGRQDLLRSANLRRQTQSRKLMFYLRNPRRCI